MNAPAETMSTRENGLITRTAGMVARMVAVTEAVNHLCFLYTSDAAAE